jgi:hypothetical protein
MRDSALRFLLLTAVVLSCSCQAGGVTPAEPTPPLAFKGYELYSWSVGGGWHFALLLGTNRIKTYDEVTASDVRLEGTAALKERLAGLARGEHVFWSVTRVPNMALPPDAVVDEISVYCQQIGVQLVVEQ